MNPVQTAQMFALLLIFLITLFVGVLGYLFFRHGNMLYVYERLLGYLNCFSGGVFFAVTIVHMQNEGRETLNGYLKKHNYDTKFPLYESLMAIGVFAVTALEQLVIMLAHGDDVSRCCGHLFKKESEEFPLPLVSGHSHSHNHNHRGSYRNSRDLGTASTLRRTLSRIHAPPPHPSRNPSERTLCAGGRSCAADIGAVESSQPLCAVETVVGHGMEVVQEGPGGMVRTLVLLVAISFHTIFDGLAMGVQKTVERVWQVFAAVAIHKAIMGFCLTLKLFTLPFEQKLTPILGYISYSLMCPAGLIVALVLHSSITTDAIDLPSGVLQGVAAGTFLYVTFFEILTTELKHESMDFIKVIFVMIGFFAMASVALLELEEDEDDMTTTATATLSPGVNLA